MKPAARIVAALVTITALTLAVCLQPAEREPEKTPLFGGITMHLDGPWVVYEYPDGLFSECRYRPADNARYCTERDQ